MRKKIAVVAAAFVLLLIMIAASASVSSGQAGECCLGTPTKTPTAVATETSVPPTDTPVPPTATVEVDPTVEATPEVTPEPTAEADEGCFGEANSLCLNPVLVCDDESPCPMPPPEGADE